MGNSGVSLRNGDSSQPAKLTSAEKRLLYTTWHRHVQGDETIGAKIFDQMFTKEPDTKTGFSHFAEIDVNDDYYNEVLHRHGSRVKASVGLIIDTIDDKNAMKSYLTTLGCRHYKEYEFDPQYITVVFRYFLQAIAELMENDWASDVESAYTKLFHLISYYMINSICSSKANYSAHHKKTAPPEELT